MSDREICFSHEKNLSKEGLFILKKEIYQRWLKIIIWQKVNRKENHQNHGMVGVGRDVSGYPGSVQDQIVWVFEQPDLAKYVPPHAGVVASRWSSRSLPAYTIIWFCDLVTRWKFRSREEPSYHPHHVEQIFNCIPLKNLLKIIKIFHLAKDWWSEIQISLGLIWESEEARSVYAQLMTWWTRGVFSVGHTQLTYDLVSTDLFN